MASVASHNQTLNLTSVQILREPNSLDGRSNVSSILTAVANKTLSVLTNATQKVRTATTASTPMEDLALPIEESSRTLAPPSRPPPAQQPLFPESTEAEKSAALAMVGCLLAAMIVFTIAYVIYQRYTCKVSRRQKKSNAPMKSLPMKQSTTAMTIAGEHHAVSEALVQQAATSKTAPPHSQQREPVVG